MATRLRRVVHCWKSASLGIFPAFASLQSTQLLPLRRTRWETSNVGLMTIPVARHVAGEWPLCPTFRPPVDARAWSWVFWTFMDLRTTRRLCKIVGGQTEPSKTPPGRGYLNRFSDKSEKVKKKEGGHPQFAPDSNR